MSQPTLETPRLTLRPFVVDDASAVQRLAGERLIADTTLNIPHPYEDGMAENWISTHRPRFEADELAVFAVTLKPHNELVGAVSLTITRAFDRAELGYWMGKAYWGSGFCTEASMRMLEFGFTDVALNKIHSSHLARNPASGRVMQKIGMSQEGVVREHVRKWGKYEDLVLYGLLRADWMAKSRPSSDD